MRCKGLHCGGCESRRGGGRLGLLLVVGVIGLIVLPEVAGSALAGLSASVAEANRAVGLGVAVLLVVAAVTAGGWVLLARRRQVREDPAVAKFSAQVQAALDARDRAGLQRIAPVTPPPSVSPNAQLQRIRAYRLDRSPLAAPRSTDEGSGS